MFIEKSVFLLQKLTERLKNEKQGDLQLPKNVVGKVQN